MDIWLVFNECSTALKQLMKWKWRQFTSFGVKFSVFQCKFNGFLTMKKNRVMWINGKILFLYAFMLIGLILSRMSEMCENKQREQTGITLTTINQICLNECNRSTHWTCDVCTLKSFFYSFKRWEGKYCTE